MNPMSTPHIIPKTDSYPWVQLDIDPEKVVALVKWAMSRGIKYGLGAKIVPLSLQDDTIDKVDCSGFFRWLIYHSCNGLIVPDGSYNQREWLEKAGFKWSTVRDATAEDGVWRVGVLDPHDTTDHIGHITLIYNGKTIESHGGHGPDMRPFTGEGWQKRLHVFVLRLK